MVSTQHHSGSAVVPVLPDDIPVVMPPLPHTRVLTTEHELKALGDPLRTRILGLVQYHPATAKQIADRLGATPSSVGHHLHVLEAADLAQVVARRSIRGTIANYYARTAVFFRVELPRESAGTLHESLPAGLDRMTEAHDELAHTLAVSEPPSLRFEAFLHFKLAPSRVTDYERRLQALTDAFIQNVPDDEGEIFTFYAVFFLAPRALQGQPFTPTADRPSGPSEQHSEPTT